MQPRLQFKRFVETDYYPKYALDGDCGIDIPLIFDGVLSSNGIIDINVDNKGRYILFHPYTWIKFRTGVGFKIPDGYWGDIRSRSSTGFKRRLITFPGTIDAGYTGEIYVLVFNPNDYKVKIYENDKLIQLVIHKSHIFDIVEVDELPQTERGKNGFGSTG